MEHWVSSFFSFNTNQRCLHKLGNEVYDANWSYKLQVYERYFPGQLIQTSESGTLSKDAEKIIKELQS